MSCKVHIGECACKECLSTGHVCLSFQFGRDNFGSFDEDIEVFYIGVRVFPVVLGIVVTGCECVVCTVYRTVVVPEIRCSIEIIRHHIGDNVEIAVIQASEAGQYIGPVCRQVGLVGDNLIAWIVTY